MDYLTTDSDATYWTLTETLLDYLTTDFDATYWTLTETRPNPPH